MKTVKRRHFMLLEVLIAFVFVATATLPLIYPHFYIYQQEKQFVNKINLDIAVNQFYAGIIERLQRNQISWNTIEEKQTLPVDEAFWRQIGYTEKAPFTGDYTFEIKHKKKNDEFGLYELELKLNVIPPGYSQNAKLNIKNNRKITEYKYTIFASRVFKAG
jgi:hypothetical protein